MKHSVTLVMPQEQFSSTHQRRTKPLLILSLILVCSSIIISTAWVFSMMKQRIGSEPLTKNPTEAMQDICQLTPFPPRCKYAIVIHQKPSTLFKNIAPSTFYSLLLNASLIHLNQRVIPIPEYSFSSKTKTMPAVKNCQTMLDDTQRLLEMSMSRLDGTSDNPDENVFTTKDTSLVVEFGNWIANATDNVEACIVDLEELRLTTRGKNDDGSVGEIRKWKVRLYTLKEFMENDVKVLEKMDLVLDKFRPSFRSISLHCLSRVREYGFGVGLFVSQYVILVYLLCRLHSHRQR